MLGWRRMLPSRARCDRAVALVVAAFPLAGCSVLVDPGVKYEACHLTNYAENFPPGVAMKSLYEHCWKLDNADDRSGNVLQFEDDLVMKANDGDTWDDAHQGPFFFQELQHDFL